LERLSWIPPAEFELWNIMKAEWKRAFIWSSLGGLILGSAVALARRARRPQLPPVDLRPVPFGCSRISVWTEHFQVDENGNAAQVQDRYLFQSTPFKVWSVLEAQPGADPGARPAGWTIYHVTHLRFFEGSAAEELTDQGQLQDRFYGTIAVIDPECDRPVRDRLGRGAILAIRKCSVGGARNGVETGEIHYSSAPLLNFRFEYAAVEKRV
jgi:hypothetical protein